MAYSSRFIKGATVPLPVLGRQLKKETAGRLSNARKQVLDYDHHSVLMSAMRKLAIYSACNIDGQNVPAVVPKRKDNWRPEADIDPGHQLDQTFYNTCGSLIDRGHLTKYEDVIWGKQLDKDKMKSLGDSTFYFSNCVPQHRTLNRGKWSSLELYILDTETDADNRKICMFTGPLFKLNDPVYKKKIGGNNVQIPEIFWKVVYFMHNKKLYAVGFIMSQETLLKKSKLIKSKPPARTFAAKLPFMDYKHSTPYQVKVETLEKLSGLDFSCKGKCNYPYQKAKDTELLFKDVDVPPARGFIGAGNTFNPMKALAFQCKNLITR